MATRKKPLGDILRDLQGSGWSPAQIEVRTGVSRRTQRDIRAGRTSGATYEDVLRQANRYDKGRAPNSRRLQPLSEARYNNELRNLRAPFSRTDRDDPNYARRLNYQRDKRAASRTAKARGVSQRQAQRDFDQAVRDIIRERSQGKRLSRDAGGPLSRYLYLTGVTDRPQAVES